MNDPTPIRRGNETRERRDRQGRIPPHDLDAEQSILGAMLLSRSAVEEARAELTADDFYRPAHQHVYAAMAVLLAAGEPVDVVTVADCLRRDGLLDEIGGPSFLLELQAVTPAISNAGRYARIVGDYADRRRALRQLADASEDIYDTANLDWQSSLTAAVASVDQRGLNVLEGYHTLESLLGRPQGERARELVEGLLWQRTRLLYIAAEGLGKKVLAMQLAMCSSQGIHPFTRRPLQNGKVTWLMIDGENEDDDIEHHATLVMRGLAQHLPRNEHGDVQFDMSTFHMLNRPDGIDLRSRVGQDTIRWHMQQHRPQAVFIGPLYQTMSRRGMETWEDAAADAMKFIKELTRQYQCAVIIEGHAAGKEPGKDGAPLVPQESKRWIQWPQVGLTMGPTKIKGPDDEDVWTDEIVTIGRFRRDRTPNTAWPDKLIRGGPADLPWMPHWKGFPLDARSVRHPGAFAPDDLQGPQEDRIGF